MEKSLIISIAGHVGLLVLMAFTGSASNKKFVEPPPKIVMDRMTVSRFDAMISEAPTNISKKSQNEPKNKNQKNELIKIELDEEILVPQSKVDKIRLQNEDQNYVVNSIIKPGHKAYKRNS